MCWIIRPLFVLAPHCLRESLLTVLRVVYAIVSYCLALAIRGKRWKIKLFHRTGWENLENVSPGLDLLGRFLAPSAALENQGSIADKHNSAIFLTDN